MVAVLLVAQIALVFLLSDVLKQRMALAYTVLQLLAGVVAMRIWARPGATSYKMGWIMLVLFVPVVGVILYLLWNGDRPSKRLRPEEAGAHPRGAAGAAGACPHQSGKAAPDRAPVVPRGRLSR